MAKQVASNNSQDQAKSRIEKRMADIARRVYQPMHQVQLYEELLTDDEKKFLFDSLTADCKASPKKRRSPGRKQHEKTPDEQFIGNGFRNVCRLAELRKLPPEEMVLSLALELGFLRGETEYNQLLSHFCGEDRRSRTSFICYTEGELRLNNVLIRKIKQYVNKKSNIELILDSFQETQWRRNSLSFKGILDPKPSVDAVYSLNRGMTGLEFVTRNAGTVVAWRLANED